MSQNKSLKKKRGRPPATGTGKTIYVPAPLVEEVEKMIEKFKQS